MGSVLIFLVVAGSGILWLWISQRRARLSIDDVEGFTESLKKITDRNIAIPVSRESRPATLTKSGRRPEPLDAARREAARRRLEERRAHVRAL